MSKFLVTKKVFEENQQYNAEIEYLESTGTQYIDTGIVLKPNYKYEVTFSCTSTNTDSKIFFGMYSLRSQDGGQAIKDNFAANCMGSWGTNNATIAIYSYPDNGIADSSFPNAVQVASRTVEVRYGEPNTVSHDSGVTYFNGQEIINRPSSMPNNPYNIPSYLFAAATRQQDTSVKPAYFFIGRIMSVIIKDAEYNIIRDFIPVRAGNVGYMYDKISKQLFGNLGTGSFILGPDTKIIEPEIPNENQPSSKFIIRKKVINITNNVNPNFSVIKKHFETKFQLSFDTNGGNTIESKEVVLGKPYGELPVPIKSQHIFLGWFTSASGGTQITSETLVSLDINTIYAQWEEVQIDSNCTSYKVTTTSSYKKTGIYQASTYNSNEYTYIDWGDGSVEKFKDNISQKTHTYKTIGTFTVKVSNNLTSFSVSYRNGGWYNSISQNRYTFKGMLTTGSRITSLPSYAFQYCQAMTNIDFMQTCWPTVTSLPDYCFFYCSGLTSIQGAKRFTSLGSYCFRYCSGLTGIQDLSKFKFTTLSNSYTFANCTNVTYWILPSVFNGTSFGSYMFHNDTKLSSLVLPNSLTSTGTHTFRGCSNLKNINIPSKVQSIGTYTFNGCTQLSNVNIEATNLTAINSYAFYNCNKLTDLDLPDTVKTIGNYAFYGCTSLDYAGKYDNELPSQLTSIGSCAYQGCNSLKSLNIPETLQTIGDYAFAGCYQISSIVDKRLTAQTVSTNTFGNTTGTGTNAYTGYQTKGNNILSTYVAATSYDENAWYDPLQNPDKCGFVQHYIDPENIVYNTVTFNAGIGEVSETTRTIIKGKKIRELPIPTVTEEQLYFCGWSSVANNIDYIIDENYRVTSDITLYAVYSTSPLGNYEVILNDQWRTSSSQSNPDITKYDGVYESNSNYNQGNKAAVMYIKIKGYTSFTIYIRSYAESSFDYTVAFNLDTYTPSKPLTSNPGSSTSGVKAHTSGKQNSGTAISSYTKVEYTGIDQGEHYICIAYRKDGSVNNGNDRGYVLIEKQDNGTFEPPKPITVNFEIGEGTLISGERTITDIQGTTISKFPEISAPISKPYLVGWNTQSDGSGEYYDNTTILPNQESLTLYAYYVAEDPIDPNKDTYLCFTAEQANSTVQLSAVGTAPTVYLQTSRTCNNILEGWSDFIVGSTTITLANVGDKVYFRAKQDNQQFANDTSEANQFVMTGKIAASGNINTLLKADGSVLDLTGRNYCYINMFKDCSSLTQAPELPATTLAYQCYKQMFYNCTSLTQAPKLPVTTLVYQCYEQMFYNCTSLTQAPELPATTLADYCYRGMFNGCTSLTQAPKLPATTLADWCYQRMFNGCTALTQAPELPVTTLAYSCYNQMFYNCTSLTQAPKLPATTLAYQCYNQMFCGCSSLTQAPELPATTLADGCYSSMFYNCTSLTQAPKLPATTLADYCYSSMFEGCSSLTQAPELPVTTLADGCYFNMFYDCSSLTQAPELPATTLADYCYSSMFKGCSSLTQAPELPATTLADGCYKQMFQSCTKLNNINVNFLAWNPQSATKNWVTNVSSSGTFECPLTLPETYGTSYIPANWTIVRK